MPNALMPDTNTFDAVLDGRLAAADLAGRRLLATGVQAAEIAVIRDAWSERRADLQMVFEEVAPEIRPAASFSLGIEGAGLDQAHWNDGTGRFDRMLAELKSLDRKAKSFEQHRNQLRDVVIAETAITLGATLVTRDANLAEVVRRFGGQAGSPTQLRLGT